MKEDGKIEAYLGDGVYATFTGETIAIDLRAQAAVLPVTQIFLEPSVLAELNRFAKVCGLCQSCGESVVEGERDALKARLAEAERLLGEALSYCPVPHMRAQLDAFLSAPSPAGEAECSATGAQHVWAPQLCVHCNADRHAQPPAGAAKEGESDGS